MNALAKTYPPFTSAEFYMMAAKGAFDGFRVELRRGMIAKTSPKWVDHARVQHKLSVALDVAIGAAGAGWEVATEPTVNFGGGFEPMPDVVVYDAALLPPKNGPISPAAVSLIVEVADSSLDDDMGEKREDYARAGVAEYWVADVSAAQLVRHANPKDGAFQTEQRLAFSEPLAMLTAPSVIVRIR